MLTSVRISVKNFLSYETLQAIGTGLSTAGTFMATKATAAWAIAKPFIASTSSALGGTLSTGITFAAANASTIINIFAGLVGIVAVTILISYIRRYRALKELGRVQNTAFVNFFTDTATLDHRQRT